MLCVVVLCLYIRTSRCMLRLFDSVRQVWARKHLIAAYRFYDAYTYALVVNAVLCAIACLNLTADTTLKIQMPLLGFLLFDAVLHLIFTAIRCMGFKFGDKGRHKKKKKAN